jgi:hypothetical protein
MGPYVQPRRKTQPMVCTNCRIWKIADLHEVIGGSGGDIVLAKDELLGDAAAQSHSHLVLKVAPAAQQMYALQELGHSQLDATQYTGPAAPQA